MIMPDLLLSELCSICHIRPHKYRCPRCSARTCSLPCVKRHKQWSQCNGVRDPATYIKRSDLTTPKGIDHDYNYLTSIERQIDSADRDAVDRGVSLQGPPAHSRLWLSQGRDGPSTGEQPLVLALEQCGVVVEKAPEGMVRKKQNTTRWDKRNKRLLWTIEWIHPDGRKELGVCSEDISVATAYAAQVKPLAPSKEDVTRPKKRRKHQKTKKSQETTVPDDLNTADPSAVGEAMPRITSAAVEEDYDPSPDRSPARDVSISQPSNGIFNGEQQEAISPWDNICFQLGLPSRTPLRSSQTQTPIPPMSGASDPPKPYAEELSIDPINESLSPTVHFYLHAPRLPSPRPVLIPLSQSDVLSDCLRDRLVLEFPTIYALPESLEILEDQYITEEAFFKQMQENGYGEKIEAKLTGNEEGEINEDSRPEDIGVDEKKLQEVLTRDLKTLQGIAN